MAVCRPFTPDEVPLYRAVRLAALETDPASFCASVAREAAYPMEEWARRAANCLGLFVSHPPADFGAADDVATSAVAPATCSGLVATIPGHFSGAAAVRGADFEIVSLWVRPEYRGHGYGRALVLAAVAKHPDALVTALVNPANAARVAFFEACGFRLATSVDAALAAADVVAAPDHDGGECICLHYCRPS